MLRWLACLGCLVGARVAWAESLPPQVADGFVVEKVADTPLVDHPMMGCFDDRGRLFVCESAGTNRPASELVADPQDQIRILEDTDGDGKFDKSTVFADRLVFPQGCLWYRGALYTCSSPYLWKLEDTDGDDVCDRRTVLVKSFGFSGNAADIHGPFLGPDGRLYWCDGRHGHEIRDLGDGQFGGEDNVVDIPPQPEPGLPNPEGSLLTRGKAARIFSCRPDGSDVQVLCGGGMDNPVEVDLLSSGECLGTVNLFYGSPRGDCLVHWIDGGVYPRYDQQDSVAEFKSTGELLTEVHNYGHVAVSGMTRYRSGPLFPGAAPPVPDADRAEFLVTQFNTHKLVHTVIQRDGATFRHVATNDLFVSPDPDCHPTDVLEDADGSLLVIDTGGWFRIGCPTSQIAKPQITGAIYRIRRADTPHIPRSELVRRLPASDKDASTDGLIAALREAPPPLREFVVDLAAQQAARDPHEVIHRFSELFQSTDPSQQELRLAALWLLGRISDPAATQALLAIVRDEGDETARLVGIRLLSAAPLAEADRQALLGVLDVLVRTGSPAARREAVLALARLRPEDAGPAAQSVIESLRGLQPDRMLEHASTFALISLAEADATAAALADPNPQIRRAALVALDQMEGGNLRREQVVPLLDTDDAPLQKAALDVIARHEGWAAEAFALVRQWVADPQPDQQRQAILRGFLSARAAEQDVQALVADSLADPALPRHARLTLLEVMGRAAVDDWPATWAAALESVLDQPDEELRLQALRVVASRRLGTFDARLQGLAAAPALSPRVRCEAFAALAPRITGEVDPDLFRFLSAQLSDPDTPVIDKLRIATGLAEAPLSGDQLCELAELLESAGPAVVPALVAVYEGRRSEQAGLALVTRLRGFGGELSLSAGDLRRVLASYPPIVQASAAPLLVLLEGEAVRQSARLDELTRAMAEGNAERGRALFFGKQAACATCHRVHGDGSQVGPDLSRIAAIRQPRDLLESILYPSASFARGYESYIVLLDDGRVVSGVIARETATDLVVRTSDLSEIRITRSRIDDMRPSPTSIMPQGLEGRMSRDDLRDLLAYLSSLR